MVVERSEKYSNQVFSPSAHMNEPTFSWLGGHTASKNIGYQQVKYLFPSDTVNGGLTLSRRPDQP
jgi:hypothetical protein